MMQIRSWLADKALDFALWLDPELSVVARMAFGKGKVAPMGDRCRLVYNYHDGTGPSVHMRLRP